MTTYHSATPQRLGRQLLVSIASTVLLASGCSNLVSTAPGSSVAGSAATISGRVHGGNQPVANATVNLYFAGQGGTGQGAVLAATTKTANDGAGSFSFTKGPDLVGTATNPGNTNTFGCPSAPGTPYVYLVARGGNTLNDGDISKNNVAAVFIAPVGLCANISSSSFTYMSEAVTAATVAAVHQYMDEPSGGIGADSILAAYDGLSNAFNTVSNMVSLSTGQTLASTSLAGSLTGVTVTASPEQAKLNQVANILSSCINNASSSATACTTLFANAVPPTSASTTSTPNAVFAPATDVLQAAFYIFTNATNSSTANRTNLYNLSGATGAPYQPTLSAVPSDWSIGIQYLASGTCGGNGDFINVPYDINVDETGNIWVANGQTGKGTLSELSPTGVPVACVSIPGGSRGGTIDTSTSPAPSGPALHANKIWIGDSEHNTVYRYNPITKATLAFPTTTPPFAMAADGTGNVYFSSITSTSASVWIIPGGASATAAVAPVQISSTVGSTPIRILVDRNNAIWASSRDAFVSIITPGTASSPNFLNGYSTVQVATPSPSYGLAANAGAPGPNGVYVSIQDPVSAIDLLIASSTGYVPAVGFPTPNNVAGLNVPSSIAVDGSLNVWAANDAVDPVSGLSLASQLTATGAALSPVGYQKAASFLVHGRSIAIDEAGNVWIGQDGSNSVTEIVGAAVPIFQPFSLGLQQGRFQTIP